MRAYCVIILAFASSNLLAQYEWLTEIKGAKDIVMLRETSENKILLCTQELAGFAWMPEKPLFHEIDPITGKIDWTKSIDSIKRVNSKGINERFKSQEATKEFQDAYGLIFPSYFKTGPVKPQAVVMEDKILVFNQDAALLFSRESRELIYVLRLTRNDLYNIEFLNNKAVALDAAGLSSSFDGDAFTRAFSSKSDYNIHHGNFTATDLQISTIGIAGSIFAGSMIAKMKLGRTLIIEDQLKNAIEFYRYGQFSYPYFIWFNYDNGWTLNLLNCTTLKRAAIKLGAANPNYLMYGTGNPFYRFSSDGRFLYTFYFTDDTYSQPAISMFYSVDINYLALAKYDLNKIEFIAAPSETIIENNARGVDIKLINSVRSSNVDSVKYFISKGADVNSWFKGTTPLLMAAGHFVPDIIKVLIDKDADGSKPDLHGWVPWHYAVMHSFNSPIVDKLKKAYSQHADGKPWKK